MVTDTPTDGKCNYEYTPSDDYKHDSGYCEGHPMDNGRCYHHGGKNENGGAPEGNDNAVTVGAWAEDFYEGFLTEAERDRVEKSAELLGDEANAKQIAQHAASVSLEQFRLTGDERFIRRFESICDKFGIAPADEVNVEGEMQVDISTLSSDEKDQLNALMDRDVQG